MVMNRRMQLFCFCFAITVIITMQLIATRSLYVSDHPKKVEQLPPDSVAPNIKAPTDTIVKEEKIAEKTKEEEKKVEKIEKDADPYDNDIEELGNKLLRVEERIERERYNKALKSGINDNCTISNGIPISSRNISTILQEFRDYRADNAKPRHVFFTTTRQSTDCLKGIIKANSLLSLKYLARNSKANRALLGNNEKLIKLTSYGDLIKVIDFPGDGTDGVRRNVYKTPILQSMYMEAMTRFPSALTYTYFNGDLVFNIGWLETVEAAIDAMEAGLFGKSRNFLIVGRRTNVKWATHRTLLDPDNSEQFYKFLIKGELYGPDAVDYFTFTKDVWDWRTIPDFVVGRPAYDNWIVHQAIYHIPTIATIDGTRTIPVIHETGVDGARAWEFNQDPDMEFNKILGKDHWWHGKTDKTPYYTERDFKTNKIVFCRRVLQFKMHDDGFVQPDQCDEDWP